MDLAAIRAGLAQSYDSKLVDELLEAHDEAKKNFYLGGLRLSAVEGGRFCEAAFRMLEQRASALGAFAPLGKKLDTHKLIRDMSNLPSTAAPDSIRLHIPRALRVVYDIRNNRDTAHLADGIDPNLQDATLVVVVLDWVLAEFVRLHHTVSANEARDVVENLVTRQAPIIQEFDGFLKVLNPELPASDHALILLYQCGAAGATYAELAEWARPEMRSNLRRTLRQLTHDRAWSHFNGKRYYVTSSGIHEVENRRLYE